MHASVEAVRAASAADRPRIAGAWADDLSERGEDDGSAVRLGELLGVGDAQFPGHRLARYCETTRASTLVVRFGSDQLDWALRRSIDEIRGLRSCGPRSVKDILSAVLLSVVAKEQGDAFEQPVLECADGLEPPSPDAPVSAGASLSSWISPFNDCRLAVLEHRVVKQDQTLNEIAVRHGLSRARIGQIDHQVHAELRSRWETDASLRPLREKVCSQVAIVYSEDRLLAEWQELDEPVSHNCRVLDLLLPVLGWTRCDGWLAEGPIPQRCMETRRTATDGSGRLQDVKVYLNSLGLSDGDHEQWLNYCQLDVIGNVVVHRTASMLDKAVAVLEDLTDPLPLSEISKLVDATSITTLRNRIQADPRFTRTGKDSYALASWGMEAFETIEEALSKRIRQSADPRGVYMPNLSPELAKKFNISESSINTVASRRVFRRENGWLSHTKQMPTASRRGRTGGLDPASTRRCYFRNGEWWFRIDVSKDTLRGSGFSVPIGISRLFQVAEGTVRQLRTGSGEIIFSWKGSQPTFGSIRSILASTGSLEGDALWVRPGSEVDIVYERIKGGEGSAYSKIALLAGFTETSADETRELLAYAVALPTSTSWSGLEQALRSRGDQDVADEIQREGLSAEISTTADVAAFLDALGFER